jgi:hypothetical protein
MAAEVWLPDSLPDVCHLLSQMMRRIEDLKEGLPGDNHDCPGLVPLGCAVFNGKP